VTKIQIDGKDVEVDAGQPLVSALHKSGTDVPTYCYHPGLSAVGSCRICQVEVAMGDGPSRVVVACRTPITEGMKVFTSTDKARDVRRECLEFLLKNHPLDCAICDKAGECDLQDYSFNEGQSEGRSSEPRRKLDKRKSLGDVILLDEERCILCSRCVRFMEEIPKTPQLAVVGLGARSTIATFNDTPLTGNYQGNLADVCPVGALTTKKFRFQARVWNLTKTPSTCGECSRGCSITNEVLRNNELKRIRPRYNEDVNEWWMCDTGRFSIDKHSLEGRLSGAQIRGEAGLEAARAIAGLERVTNALRTHESRVILASAWLTIEEGQSLVSLAKQLAAEVRFVTPAASELADDLLHTDDPCPNRRGLTEAGLTAIDAQAALELINQSEVAVLIGERIAETIGIEALAEVPSTVRLFALDTVALNAPAVRASIGVPSSIERSGTWVNVDGFKGMLTIARPAPNDVAPLLRTLSDLAERIAPAETAGGAI
jgi:NADH-quinone oxidoreductase subunit G